MLIYGYIYVYISKTIPYQLYIRLTNTYGVTYQAFGTVFVCLFCLFRATPTAYGISQARGRIRAMAAGHSHSHSNAGSEHLQLAPQLKATLDPLTH